MLTTKRQARALPLHELRSIEMTAWLEWRFADRGTDLERRWERTFALAANELYRRRLRGIQGGCSCEVCCHILGDPFD